LSEFAPDEPLSVVGTFVDPVPAIYYQIGWLIKFKVNNLNPKYLYKL